MMYITEMTPATKMTALRIFWMTLGKSPTDSTLVQPEAALVSSDMCGLSQMLSSAKVDVGARRETPSMAAMAVKLTNFLNFIILLCGFY